MFGPGEYVPDPTEGIVDVNDLPPPIICLTTAISTTVLACDVGIWLIATNPASALCMIWAI
jgi:hypothetical protein